MLEDLDFSRVDSGVNHGDMAEDAVDIDVHLLFREVFDELHVAVADCIHKGVPIVRCIKFVYEMGEGIEEIDDLLCLALLYLNA